MASGSAKYQSDHVDFGRICTKFWVLYRLADFTNLTVRLMRTVIIDHQMKPKALSYLSVITVIGSQKCIMSAVCGSRGLRPGSLLRRTSLQMPVKETIYPLQGCLVC